MAALTGLAAIAFAIWATTNVLLPASRDMPALVGDPKVQAIFDRNFELLNGHGRSITEFQTNFDNARAVYVAAAEAAGASGGTGAAKKEKAAKVAFSAFSPTVDRIMSEGLLITVTERFIRARKIMVVSAFVAGVAVVAFTWAANPSSTSTNAKAGADRLTAVAHGVGVEIAHADAIALLTAKGVHNARTVVDSFTGGLEIRTVGTHDHFFRYTTTAHDGGSYLTRLSFHGPTTTRLALHLPYADTAACIESISVLQPTLVLEGQVAQGRPGVLQLFMIKPHDFNHDSSTTYKSSPEPCPL